MSKVEKQKSLKPIWIVLIINILVSSIAIGLHFKGGSKSDEIVYVDALKLMSKYKGMETAQKDLAQKSQVWKANIDTLKQEMDEAIKAYEISKKNGSSQAQQAAQELAKSKQQRYYEYEQTIKDQYQKEDKERSAKILSTVNDYMKRYGESHHYKIILTATHYGNIAYAQDALDITEEILKGINEEYNKVK